MSSAFSLTLNTLHNDVKDAIKEATITNKTHNVKEKDIQWYGKNIVVPCYHATLWVVFENLWT